MVIPLSHIWLPRIDYEPTANWYNWTYRCLPAASKVPIDRLSSVEILKWGTQHDPDATYIKRRFFADQSIEA